MTHSPVKKICYVAMFVCIGILAGYLESFIVLPVSVPGIKIGLSNIVTIIALYLLGPLYAFFICVCRVLLSSILFGSGISSLYSITGALISFIGMFLLFRCDKISVYGVSIAGGALHNASQLAVALIIVKVPYLYYYFPILIISGILAGFLIGFLSKMIIDRLKKTGIFPDKGY